jgi:hypothetical protein
MNEVIPIIIIGILLITSGIYIIIKSYDQTNFENALGNINLEVGEADRKLIQPYLQDMIDDYNSKRKLLMNQGIPTIIVGFLMMLYAFKK